MSQALATAAATTRTMLSLVPEISASTTDVVSEIIQSQLTGEQLAAIHEIIQNRNATLEPPMSVTDACRLLGVSKACLHYHCRQGRIRRVKVPGAVRGRGVVAADVRRIVEGGVA